MNEDDLFFCKTENDVRERIIYPLLLRLDHSPATIITQLTLHYKSLFLGRKKGFKKDRPLQGEADYVVDVDGRLRWVIEAKKPGPISNDDREQAFSYAMHPQVRAVMFAIISGTDFEIFHTFYKPEAGPILKFQHADLESNFLNLFNLVSPDGLRRLHSDFTLDVGQSLAPGLRSFAVIENGRIEYTECPPFREDLLGIIVHLNSGSLVRQDAGGISAFISPSFHHQKLDQFSEVIGAKKLEFITFDEFISTNPIIPTVFKHTSNYIIPSGTTVPRLMAQDEVRTSTDITFPLEIEISGYLEAAIFVGFFTVRSCIVAQNLPIQFNGLVKLQLK